MAGKLPLRRIAFALLAAMPLAAGLAQRGGGYVDVIIEEPSPEPTPSPSAAPGVTPTPVPSAVPSPVAPPQPRPPELPTPHDVLAYEDPALDAVTRPELTRFKGDSEFQRYMDQFDQIETARWRHWAGRTGPRGKSVVVAAARLGEQDGQEGAAGEPCTDPTLCPEDSSTVVTASRIAAPTITNNQSAGVDEGDIVKQIGDYFLVLQDGQIFAVNIAGMKLTDRAEVFRRDSDGDPTGADWYDEMLVQDDHLLVTAYSYEDEATELSVFRLDQASGKLARLGVFLISSNDYYSRRNYATRIVGDRLVIYSPYQLDDLEDGDERPIIRRWMGPTEREDAQKQGKPLLDPTQLYWPVIRTREPTLHTVSICPLSQIATRDLACKTTGFVGPQKSEMYVSAGNVFLWNSLTNESADWRGDPCIDKDHPTRPRAQASEVIPGVVYRVPIGGGEPSLLAVRGTVTDQFSMDQYRGRFRTLARWEPKNCRNGWEDPAEFSLFDVSLKAFGQVYEQSKGEGFRNVPAPQVHNIENRFIDDWLIYGGRGPRGGRDYENDDEPRTAPVIAVPLGGFGQAQVFEPGHQVVRIERVGNNAMVAGYRDDTAFSITMLRLGGKVSLGGQVKLANRAQSESRSHAFNSTMDADGNGLMGIPTTFSTVDEHGWREYADATDINFLAFGADASLRELGVVAGRVEDDVHAANGYVCEVSCIDWYGNARPIFSQNRVFALMGTDLVELAVRQGAIAELHRIDMTGPISRN